MSKTQNTALYAMVVRVCGIFAVLSMAIVDDMNKFYNNDVWYAGVIAAIVIGPNLLDRVATLGDGTPPPSTITRINILFAMLTIFIAVARFAGPL